MVFLGISDLAPIRCGGWQRPDETFARAGSRPRVTWPNDSNGGFLSHGRYPVPQIIPSYFFYCIAWYRLFIGRWGKIIRVNYIHTHIYTLYNIYISVNIGPGPIFFIFIFWDIMEQPPNSPWRFSSLGKSWNNWRFSSHVWWHQRVVSQWKFVHWKFMRHIFLGKTFPECVARVPVSLWGSGGWGCVRSTLRNRSQLLATVSNRSQLPATVCNRPQPPANVRTRSLVPMASSAAGVTFGGFTCPVQTYLFFTW